MEINVEEVKRELNKLYGELEELDDERSRRKMMLENTRNDIRATKNEIEALESKLYSVGVEWESELLSY